MKQRRVSGEARVSFTVLLPKETANEKVVCDDPAEEAVLCALGGDSKIFLWGADKKPAQVIVESFEEDIDIEEDEELECP